MSNQSGENKEWVEKTAIFCVLIMAVALVLFGLPILILGFLIGLFWYSAFIAGEYRSYSRMIWPLAITFLFYVLLIGLPQSIDPSAKGLLFSDFLSSTKSVISFLVNTIVPHLPKKLQSRISISDSNVRNYLWCSLLIAAAVFGLLRYKNPKMKPSMYLLANALMFPLKVISSNIRWLIGFIVILAFAPYSLKLSHSVKLSVDYIGQLLIVYAVSIRAHALLSLLPFDLRGFFFRKKKKIGTIDVGCEQRRGNRVVISEPQLNHHVHIVGASGFGKSVLLSHIVRNRIESGSGMLFIDLKADFETIRQVVSIAKASGRLNDLQIFSCGNPEISNSYNVLASGSANQLKDRIMGALVWSEEFYKNEAQSFLLRILKALTYLRDRKGRAFDLKSIYDLASDVDQVLDLVDLIPKAEAAELYEQTLALAQYLSKLENQKSLRGLKSQLESLILSEFGDLLRANVSGINLFNAVQSKKIVFILLDSRTYGESAHALGKLILQDLKAMSAKIDNEIPRENRTPFTVVVDEFADLATDDFVGFLDRARSSKIGVVVAHQEIADLDRVSPEFTKRLMNSTSTLFAFLQKLPDSSELIAGISGTRKVEEVTEQAQSSILGFGDVRTGMKSIKIVDEFNIHPNTVRSLPVGQCVVIEKYPYATSQIVRVRQEETDDYLSEDDVRDFLKAIRKSKAKPEPVSANRNERFRDEFEVKAKETEF